MSFNSMLNTLKRQAVTLTGSTTSPNNPSSNNTTHTAKDSKDLTSKNKRIKVERSKLLPTVQVSKIYLISPPNVRTGGPEAMHQLCHQINALASSSSKFPVTAYMLYLEEKNGTFQHVTSAKPLSSYSDIYSRLQIAPSSWKDDMKHSTTSSSSSATPLTNTSSQDILQHEYYSDSLLIWPEVWTHLLMDDDSNHIHHSKHHQQCIWWLSVDNNNGKFTQWDRQDVLHLYQSEYAKQYILRNMKLAGKDYSRCVLPMTEFIPLRPSSTTTNSITCTSTLKHTMEDHPTDELVQLPRDLQVLYNPLKGIHYTDEIRKRSEKKITFTPIGGGPHGRERISYEEVKTMLQRAKIYLDFGPHPGMDRLPREAALAKCIVITNREGAAGYREDVPIPEEYKIQTFQVDKIHKLLMECLESYNEKVREFDEYREWIQSQEERMKICVSQFLEFVTVSRIHGRK